MNIEIIKDIFKSHKINKVIMIKEPQILNFVICSMSSSLDFNRWNNLENILKYHTKEEISLTSYHQAEKYLGKDYLNKGVIICD